MVSPVIALHVTIKIRGMLPAAGNFMLGGWGHLCAACFPAVIKSYRSDLVYVLLCVSLHTGSLPLERLMHNQWVKFRWECIFLLRSLDTA